MGKIISVVYTINFTNVSKNNNNNNKNRPNAYGIGKFAKLTSVEFVPIEKITEMLVQHIEVYNWNFGCI